MSNKTDDLHPFLQPSARQALANAQAKLDVQYPGSKVVVAETARSVEDQAKDAANGSSDVKIGWHQYYGALDYLVIDAAGHTVQDGSDPRYALVGEEFKVLGWHYPIILKDGTPDYDHVQAGATTLALYQAWLSAHPVPT